MTAQQQSIRGSYDDIMDLPRPLSKEHPRMPLVKRAAQFSPFAALTGYEDAIHETARQTEFRAEPDENEKDLLDLQLAAVREQLDVRPAVLLTYFKPDAKKSGGSYESLRGCVKNIDDYKGVLVLTDGSIVPLADIVRLQLADTDGMHEYT